MTKTFVASILPLALVAAGCGEAPEAVPEPDPATLERVVASLKEPAPAEENSALAEKAAEADRIAPALAKVQPEKLDPNIVATVIAR